MNQLTASIALAVVQLCSGLIMTGVFLSTPSERCTRYWALSGGVIAFGIICIVWCSLIPPDAAGRNLLLLLGNTGIFAGGIASWVGLRCFYQRAVKWSGWLMVATYTAAYTFLLASGASFTERSYLVVVCMQCVFLMVLYEMVCGLSGAAAKRYPRWTFGRIVGICSLLIMSAAYIARLILSTRQPALFEPPHVSNLGVMLVYIIPLGGGLLLSSSLLLLYFERMVADKQRLATVDVLTGTLNRRELVRCGEEMLQQVVAQRCGLTLAFIDVDHFKKINDRFGHQVGDRVLSGISMVLLQNCRENDLLGRYGGEEFCAVFPGLTRDEACRIGERLVLAVRNHRFEHGAPVTISVGLVSLLPGQLQDWDALVHQADLALYQAKNEGRNDFRMALPA